MKSFWKSLVESALLIAVSAGAASNLVAQDGEQAGVVRIAKSSPVIHDSQLTPANASCVPSNGACGAGMGGPCRNGYCDPSMNGMYGGANGMHGANGMGGMYGGNGMYGGSGMSGGLYDPYVGYNDPYAGYDGRGRRASRHADGDDDGRGGRRRGHGHHWGHGNHCDCPNGNGQAFCNYLRCKFGYFIPTGGGGAGLPWVGHYSRVYPVDPSYVDSRDGQAWAAQGYGIPVSVPLAPVVGHVYDYSWGVPSSRLTPISRPAY